MLRSKAYGCLPLKYEGGNPWWPTLDGRWFYDVLILSSFLIARTLGTKCTLRLIMIVFFYLFFLIACSLNLFLLCQPQSFIWILNIHVSLKKSCVCEVKFEIPQNYWSQFQPPSSTRH